MKKLLLLVLLAIMMAGCREKPTLIKQAKINKRIADDYTIVELDSCEYISWHDRYGFQHKGNCKFCAERRKKELEELIIKLKEK